MYVYTSLSKSVRLSLSRVNIAIGGWGHGMCTIYTLLVLEPMGCGEAKAYSVTRSGLLLSIQ